MLAQISTALVPVFAIIALGYLTVRTSYLLEEDFRALGRFVLSIATPALIFSALAGAPLDVTLNSGFLLAYAAASLAVFAFGYLRARGAGGASGSGSAVQALGMSASNSGFMGYPIAVMVIGSSAGPILAQCMIVENLLIIPLAILVADVGQQSRAGFRLALLSVLGGLVRNPLLLALAAGVFVATLELSLPQPLAVTVSLLASVAAPVALFVVGGTLAALPTGGGSSQVGWVVVGKLGLHPLAAFAALTLTPGLNPTLVAGGVLFASVPMISIYPIIGQRYGEEAMGAKALFAATVASCISLSILVLALRSAGLITPVG